MLRKCWCASPTFESLHARLGSSRVIEEQSEGQHRWGEEWLASRRAATPCHVRKVTVLYAYGEVLVRNGGCQLSSHLFFPKTEASHVYLCAG
jgi:hypothetical protein